MDLRFKINLIFCLVISSHCVAQQHAAKLDNSHNGTYILQEASPRMISNDSVSTLFITIFGLTAPDCKSLFGKIDVNGKSYNQWDTSTYTGVYTFKADLKPGKYFFNVSAKGFYDFRSGELECLPNFQYSLKFYLAPKEKIRVKRRSQ